MFAIIHAWSDLYVMNADNADHQHGKDPTFGSPWTLRPAREGDFEAVASLVSESVLPTEGLRDQFGDSYVVAEREGKIVGAGGIEVYGHYGLLRSVAVFVEMRGKRMGEALVEDRMNWAAHRGLKAVYLLTTTAPGFFKKQGFSIIDRGALPEEVKDSTEFSRVCPSSATAVVATLHSSNAG